MTSYLPLDLPWDEIKAWHVRVCEKCDAAISLCSSALKELREDEQKTENLHPFDVLKCLLGNDSTCHFFGTPNSKPITLSEGADFPSHVERQQWGHRMYCYIKELRCGFERWNMVEHSSKVLKRLEKLQMLEDQFATEFKGNTPPVEDFKEAMRCCSDPHVFADFTFSRVDPTLHASLTYLNMPELSKSDDLQDFLINNIRAFLSRLMLAHIEVGMKPPVIDESHLWWGHYELLKHEGENYSVNGKSGYSIAAEVCRKLIYKGRRFFAYPKRDIAIHEIPPDIYGIQRTHLLVLMNCINISMIMPSDTDSELPALMSECVMQHLDAIKSFGLVRLYYLGLALQTSSTAMKYHNDFVENDGDTKNQVDTAESDSRAETKVWLLEEGGFLVEHVNKPPIPIAMDVDCSFFIIISNLIEYGGKATKAQLEEITGINDPGRVIKRTLENPAFNALKPHIIRPGRKFAGGYRLHFPTTWIY